MTTTTAAASGSTHHSMIRALNQKLLSALHINNDDLACAVLSYGCVDRGNTSIITLTGTIDILVASDLHHLLLNRLSDRQNLVIYMSDVYRLDSAGAATLLDIYVIARGIGAGFALVAISENVRQTFMLCGLEGILPLFDTMAEPKSACRNFEQPEGSVICEESGRNGCIHPP